MDRRIHEPLANLELHESRFESAKTLFEEALGRLEERGDGLSREGAIVSDNLGYCHIAMDRVEVGLPYVQRAISLLESLGARQAMDYPCLDLCFAMLKLEKLDQGESWGIRALGLGNEFGRQDVVKNSHYLLAEIYATMDTWTARTSTTRRSRLLPRFSGVEALPAADQRDRHAEPESWT